MSVFDDIKTERFPAGKYAIFGSGPMAIRWLRVAHDADIIVNADVYDAWSEKADWRLTTTDDGEEYLQKGKLTLWRRWRPGDWDVGALIRGAEEIDGLYFVGLDEVLKWKRAAWREKDIRDVILIERYLHPDAKKPVMIYDGHCAFCRTWVAYWRRLTGDQVIYAAFQDVGKHFPEIPHEHFHRSVQLAMPDGRIFEGAMAIHTALATVPGMHWMLWAHEHVPLLGTLCDAAYRFASRHRKLGAKLTRLFWGNNPEPSTYMLTRWIFMRAIAVLYFIAFMSLFVQVTGLLGGDGILPAAPWLEAVKSVSGPERYWFFPTVAWWGASDMALQFYCLVGVVLSLFVFFGFAAMPALILCYALYLSMVTIGQDFLAFQWDDLLLEMGFLAIFLAPRSLLPGIEKEDKPSATVRWLFWLLLFRFLTGSGLVKIFSGDPTWRDLTALSYHYLTQPLPNPLSWYMYHLPIWFHKGETLLTFFFELAVPFLIFMPRRLRMFGAGLLIVFQVFLQLTGNYTAFNFQAIALCLLLLDDVFLRRFFSKKMAAKASKPVAIRRRRATRIALAGTFGLMFAASGLLIASLFVSGNRTGGPVFAFYELLKPFAIINYYGPFAVMTTERDEVIVEGSSDGQTWLSYEFSYKPGDVRRMPAIVAPHHPRLDWQMWFASLSDYQHTPWFVNFVFRLLEGSPEVLALLEKNPFPVTPPKYVRAELYKYEFTTPEERAKDGTWWKRTLKGEYLPPTTLSDFVR